MIPPHQVKNEAGDMISVKEYYELRRKMMTDDNKEHDWIWQRKKDAIRWHFEKVAKANCILVLNFEKNGVVDYIGGILF